MAAKTKKDDVVAKPVVREELMVNEGTEKPIDIAARRTQRAASREKRQERKAEREAKREATRKERVDSGKAARLCSLATVEVKKGNDGFHVSVSGSQGSRTFTIAPDQKTQVLRDLETAIQVIRDQ